MEKQMTPAEDFRIVRNDMSRRGGGRCGLPITES